MSSDNFSLTPPSRTASHDHLQNDWPDDDEALLELSSDSGKTKPPENYWCLRDAFEGTQVFGATGSGKSSGSGQAIARSFLEGNLGGLVLTAKTDEVLAWREYAEATGRSNDLLVIEPGGKYKFNFLNYELQRPGKGAGLTENLVNLFASVLEAAQRKPGMSGGGDPYWDRTLRQLLRNAVDLSIIAAEEVNLPSLYKIITSAPRSNEEVADTDWRNSSVCYGLLEVAKEKAQQKKRVYDYEMTHDYWLKEFPNLASETRSVIVSSFTSMADCFLRGLLRDLFCGETTIKPEDSFSGKIILINLPIKEFNELGQFSQVLFKLCWQRAVERRIPPGMDRDKKQASIRPVFLWVDESQFFVTNFDALYQSTARSSRACTVYLTQNLPSYISAFGGSNAQSDAESFLGNLQTKIFHAQGDPNTNNWASNSIGKTKQMTFHGGLTEGQGGPTAASNSNQNAGGSVTIQYLVQPQEFTMLRGGGSEGDFMVDSIIFQGGRKWLVSERGKTVERNFIRHVFPQKYARQPGTAG